MIIAQASELIWAGADRGAPLGTWCMYVLVEGLPANLTGRRQAEGLGISWADGVRPPGRALADGPGGWRAPEPDGIFHEQVRSVACDNCCRKGKGWWVGVVRTREVDTCVEISGAFTLEDPKP